MELLQEKDYSNKSFLGHVFNGSEEGKAEILNVVQYAGLALIPVGILNKLIQKFVPEADPEKSSMEILVEIILQIVALFVGMILIHRTITWIPTYSGFKYDALSLTSVILAFLIILMSIQSKLGIKVNILFDRVIELWDGSPVTKKANIKNKIRFNDSILMHSPSQADNLDNSRIQNDLFPPAPVATAKPQSSTFDTMMRGSPAPQIQSMGPMAANSVLGGSFGALF